MIGHFTVGSAAKVDVMLLPQATQLVVIEAKIHSPLSRRTLHASTYDQAARNVACIAELLSRAHRLPSDFQSLAFVVIAPQQHIKEGGITAKLEKLSIEKAVRSRAQDFSPELDAWLDDWFIPTLETIRIEPLAWEHLISDIAAIDQHTSQGFTMFYDRCLKL